MPDGQTITGNQKAVENTFNALTKPGAVPRQHLRVIEEANTGDPAFRTKDDRTAYAMVFYLFVHSPNAKLLTDPIRATMLMCLPDRVRVFADCAVNPDPTAEQLADIACRTANTAAAFGIDPRVALVSYATGASADGAGVAKVREAAELVAACRPDLPLAGPIQYDAAIDPAVRPPSCRTTRSPAAQPC